MSDVDIKAIEQEYREWLRVLSVQLSVRNPFYSSIFFNTQFGLDNSLGTAYANGKQVYFPHDFKKFGPSRKEFNYVVLHELLHNMLFHCLSSRKGSSNALLWNIAADYAVNNIIDEDIENDVNSSSVYMKRPERVVYDKEKKYRGKSVEEIYHDLQQNPPPDVKKMMDEQKDLVDRIKQALKDGTFNPDDMANTRGLGDTMIDIADLGLEQDMLNKLAEALATSRMAGKDPGGVRTFVDKSLYPEIDWRVVLERFVEPYTDDYDFSRKDRRFSMSDFFLPDIGGDKVKISLGIDTSGSISETEIQRYVGEILGMLSSYSSIEITVLAFHSNLYYEKDVQEEADLEDVLSNLETGGTSFVDTIARAEELGEALIMFTDGYGPFPSAPNIPVLWISYGGNTEYPFGEVTNVD